MEQGVQTAPAASNDDDGAEIRRTIAEAEKHQSDLEPFVALHTADAVIVNIAGRRVLGRTAIHQAMTQSLESPLAKVFTKSVVEDLRFVRPDVAIVSCTKHVSDERDDSSKDGPGGRLPSAGSLTYVMVREKDAWRIACAQTTPIAD